MPAIGNWIPDELPRIRGNGWWVFLPVWLAICVAAAIGMAVPLAEDWAREGNVVSASGSAGIGLKSDAQGRPIIMYPQTDEAARAGIVSGLRIVMVDGKPVATVDEAQRRLGGKEGTITRLDTIASDGRRSQHRLTRDPGHLREAYDKANLSRSTLFAASVLGFYIGGCLLPLVCGAFLLVRRPGDRLAPWASLAMLSCALGFGPPAAWYSNYDSASVINSIFGGGADLVIESSGAGFDMVFANASYQLRAGVEVEVLSASSHVAAGVADGFALVGNEVAQLVIGNDAGNIIDGGLGADSLIGLGGADTFVFSTALSAENIDTIVDFVSGSDRLGLESDIFVAVTDGGIAAGEFVFGTAASDADDRLIYDATTGKLFYDADGNGEGAAVQFAQLTPGTVLTATDFVVFEPTPAMPV